MAVGRPSKLDTLNMEAVELLAKKGFTDKEMAKVFGVTEQTFNNWKKKNKSFFESLKDWKSVADERVERSLYERAVGYSHPDTKFATYEGKITDSQEYIKHYAPDPTAIIFWLKNRKREEWKDRWEDDQESKDEQITKLEISVVTPDGNTANSD